MKRRDSWSETWSDDEGFINGQVFSYKKEKKKRPQSRVSKRRKTNYSETASLSHNPLSLYLGDDLATVAPPEDEPMVDSDNALSEADASDDSSDTFLRPNLIPKFRPRTGGRNIYESSDGDLSNHSITGALNSQDASNLSNSQRSLQPSEKNNSSVASSETESETESDTEANPTPAPDPNEEKGSETEDDDDQEAQELLRRELMTRQEEEAKRLEARPHFDGVDPPSWKGPFVLDATESVEVPGSINRYLREYQRDGIKFLYDKWREGRGGILGDDMGLGKTIQVISFLSAIMRKFGDNRDLDRRYQYIKQLQQRHDWKDHLPAANSVYPTCLIIAPTTLVYNWDRELKTWGYFEVGIYAGSQRNEQLTDFRLGRLDIMLVSLELASKDIDVLDILPWSCIFIDEAHRMKNSSSQLTVNMNKFNCLVRFGLTGTAIQNDYSELWTLLDWSNPGRLGTAQQWKSTVADPLKIGQSQKANEEELAIARTLAARLVYKLLPNFFLRRTKALISDQMPNKQDEVVFCPMTPVQVEVYKRFLADWNVPRGRGEMLKCISILMKLSNHLALILPSPHDSPEKIQQARELASVAFSDRPTPSYGLAVLDANFCGKWKVLDLLLKRWRQDSRDRNKVLIFSRSVRLITMLEYHLKRRDYDFRRLDGTTKQSDRMPIVDEFNNNPSVFVFLISTQAGGTGLNLTAANKVVLFDPNWNPAHDLQAIDRAFRLGQRRDVSVYRLLSAGSIEEHIYRRQIYKQQQMAIGYEASMQTRYFDGVQGYKGKEGDLFGAKNLFSFRDDNITTKITIEKANENQLTWALTHMESGHHSGAIQKNAGSQSKLTIEEESLVKDEPDLQGLANFLFEDELDKPVLKHDHIQEMLSTAGVKYSHYNDVLLKPSFVEEKVTENAIKNHRHRKSQITKVPHSSRLHKDSNPSIPTSSWPPKRKHHKPLDICARLKRRTEALVALKYIDNTLQLDKFASIFILKTEEEQKHILRELDDWVAG